jgi:hypothetical protein
MKHGQGFFIVGALFLISFALMDIAFVYNFSDTEKIGLFLTVLLLLSGGLAYATR